MEHVLLAMVSSFPVIYNLWLNVYRGIMKKNKKEVEKKQRLLVLLVSMYR